MIRRSLGELYESIREFFVAIDDQGQVIGCAALHVFWEDLAELKCLAVSDRAQGAGVGRDSGRGLLGGRSGAGADDGFHADLRPWLLREVWLPPHREGGIAAQDLERVRALPAVPQLQRGGPDPHDRAGWSFRLPCRAGGRLGLSLAGGPLRERRDGLPCRWLWWTLERKGPVHQRAPRRGLPSDVRIACCPTTLVAPRRRRCGRGVDVDCCCWRPSRCWPSAGTRATP